MDRAAENNSEKRNFYITAFFGERMRKGDKNGGARRV